MTSDRQQQQQNAASVPDDEAAEVWLVAEYERGYADAVAAIRGGGDMPSDERIKLALAEQIVELRAENARLRDGAPKPTDGPDYHADLAFWKERHAR